MPYWLSDETDALAGLAGILEQRSRPFPVLLPFPHRPGLPHARARGLRLFFVPKPRSYAAGILGALDRGKALYTQLPIKGVLGSTPGSALRG